MRTTLDIDDAVLSAAKDIADTTNSTAGEVISQLARKGLAASSGQGLRTKSGFPVFSVPAEADPFTSSTVKSILSNEGLP
jgi:hypothetical protein